MRRIIYTVALVGLLAACGFKGTDNGGDGGRSDAGGGDGGGSDAGGPAVTSIAVDPASSPFVAPGDTVLYGATATLDDGTREFIIEPITWASSDPTVATIDAAGLATGLATAVAVGATDITATYKGVTSAIATLGVNCGSDTMVDVSGTASLHPLTAFLDPTATLAGSEINLEDPGLALAGRDAVLKHLDCTDATATAAPTWSFTRVNSGKILLGLLTVMDDADPAGTVFVDSAAGVHAGPLTDNLTGARAIVVTENTEAALATIAGMSPGDLNSAGWILGMFVDAAGAPIDNVTLVDPNGNPIASAIYPNATFSGVETDGTTSPNGSFVVAAVALGNYGGSKTGLTFTSQQAATSAGAVFIMFLIGM